MKAGPKTPGAIRAIPHADPALLARESDIAHLMQQWFEHSLALAKQQQRCHENDSLRL